MTKNSMPWESGSSEGKYQYHPGGDASAAPKSAPSAVNVVVVPDVSLPKVCLTDPLVDVPAQFEEPFKRWRADLLVGTAREVEQVGQGRLLDYAYDIVPARINWHSAAYVYRTSRLGCVVTVVIELVSFPDPPCRTPRALDNRLPTFAKWKPPKLEFPCSAKRGF